MLAPGSHRSRSTTLRAFATVCAVLAFCSTFGLLPVASASVEPWASIPAHDVLASRDARDAMKPVLVARVLAKRRAERIARANRARTAARAAAADAKFRAAHMCPVDHPRLFSDDFGDPRKGGHVHLGNDVVAPKGTPIRAPMDGRVTHGTDPRGGTILKLWVTGGHFYMAHLSKYGKEGDVIHGDIIGYVGDSGEAHGGPPHNHLEWHPGNGKAIDPYELLTSLCGARTSSDIVVGLRLMGLPRHPKK